MQPFILRALACLGLSCSWSLSSTGGWTGQESLGPGWSRDVEPPAAGEGQAVSGLELIASEVCTTPFTGPYHFCRIQMSRKTMPQCFWTRSGDSIFVEYLASRSLCKNGNSIWTQDSRICFSLILISSAAPSYYLCVVGGYSSMRIWHTHIVREHANVKITRALWPVTTGCENQAMDFFIKLPACLWVCAFKHCSMLERKQQ